MFEYTYISLRSMAPLYLVEGDPFSLFEHTHIWSKFSASLVYVAYSLIVFVMPTEHKGISVNIS